MLTKDVCLFIRPILRASVVAMFLFAVSLLFSPPAFSKTGLTKVALQLKWHHQFQFAGFYAATAKGFYQNAGLEVEILEGGPRIHVQDVVLSGKADFGILGSELLFLRSKGLKIVELAPIIQHSVRTIIARKDKHIASPHDLVGKIIMLNENELPEFQAMFLNEGIPSDKLRIIAKDSTANRKFISGDIDAMNGSTANQPFLFVKSGIPFNLIKPIQYGIDFYGDTLFTTESKVKREPEMVSAFLGASCKGWKYAFDHPDEIIDLIREKYNPKKSRAQLDFEQARLRDLVHPDLVEIGHNNPQRWLHIKETYQKLGLISPDFSLNGFFYEDYQQTLSLWIKRLIALLGLISAIALVILFYNFQMKKNVKMITRKIQENREYLKTILTSIGDAVISVDLSQKIVTMNPVAEALTGWSFPEAQGMGLTTVFDIVNSKTGEVVENPVTKVIEKGEVVGLANHTVLIAKDKTRYHISDSGAPMKNSEGEIIGVVIVFRDVTEEYRNLEQIINLGKFPSENPNPVIRVTPDGILRYANKGSSQLLDHWGSRINEPIPQKWAQKISQAMETNQILQMDETHPKGSLSLTITPVKEMNYVNIYGMDNTEQKEHFERFKTVMDSLEALVYVIDMETYEILFVNQYGIDLWGDIRGDVCWKSLQKGQTGPCAFCTNDRLLNPDSTPADPVVWEFQNTVNNEWYECRDQAIRWMDGRMVRMEIASNITRRKKAEQEKDLFEERLRQSHKLEAIGTIAGGIAHDFNNILGIIMGNTELALDDMPVQNPALKNLKEIKTACLRARSIVKQLLNFSRKSEESKRNINLCELIEETINLLRASIPTSIEIQAEIPEKQEPILANPTQIHQVLINLCTNAAHAMEEKGGVLSIRLSEIELDGYKVSPYQEIRPGRYVRLTISDTGCGIDPSIKDRIFDPYFTTKEMGKGTGMGLAVVLGIVKNHNGAITVYSEPDQGSSFKLLFPMAAGEELTELRIDENLPEGSEKILFVDDELSIVDMGAQILSRLGYHVYTETNPLAALAFFKANPTSVDLVITDMTMPHLRGDFLALELLKINPHLPIILCTGFSHKIDQKKAVEMGIRSYVEKPFDKFELATAVKKVLSGD